MRFIDAIRAQGKGLRTSRAAVVERLDAMDLAAWRGRWLALTGMGASSNAIAAALPGYWAAGIQATGWGAADLALALAAQAAPAGVAVPTGLAERAASDLSAGPAASGAAAGRSAGLAAGPAASGPARSGRSAGLAAGPAASGAAAGRSAGLAAGRSAGPASGLAAGAEAVIAVSQTGRSAEVHAALNALPATCPRLAVTDVADSPIGALAHLVLPLGLLEDSNVRTIGYTGTIQALLLLRDALARIESPGWDQIADQTERLTAEAETLANNLPDKLRAAETFDVVGSGPHAGTAAQGALLLREVAKLPAAAYETHQYLHGPVEAAGAGRALIVIGGAREVRLAESLADAGAHVLLVTDQAVKSKRALVFRVPDRVPDGVPAGAIHAVLPLQTIAWRLAEDRALPDGVFRYHQDDTKVG